MDLSWKENIYKSVQDLSNLEKQRELWLGLNPDYCSSFDEDMNLLFDSFCFEEFIDKWHEEDLDREILEDFVILKEELNNYEKKPTDEEILEDPRWLEIVNRAGIVIKKWNV